MNLIHLIIASCLWPLTLPAQSLPPVTFAWDAPADPSGVLGYRLEWGPQDAAEVPVQITRLQVENFPAGLLLPVSVASVGSTTNSEPTTIHVFHIEVMVEESDDLAGTNWQPIASVLLLGQRKPTSFLRLSLKPTP